MSSEHRREAPIWSIVALRTFSVSLVGLAFLSSSLSTQIQPFLYGTNVTASTEITTRSQRIAAIEQSLPERLAPLDGQYYLDIARYGYRNIEEFPGSNLAWFPLFPAVIRGLDAVSGAAVIATLIANQVFIFLALVLVYRIAVSYGLNGQFAIIWFTVWPTAFFFTLLYSESLFLLLCCTSMYFTRTGRWLPAGIAGFLSALTRPPGVLIALYLLYESCGSQRHGATHKPRRSHAVLACTMPIAGFVVVLFIQWAVAGDPLAFLHQQQAFGRQLSLVGPASAIRGASFHRFPISDLLATALSIGLLPVIWTMSRSLFLYGLTIVLLPLSTGSVMSMGRFFLVSIPHFLALSYLSRSSTLVRSLMWSVALLLQALLLKRAISWAFVG